MRTTTIKATYRLTEDVYRAEVATATGPVPRERHVLVPVGEVSPEARLALLGILHDPRYSLETLAERETPAVDVGERAAPPTAGDVSAALIAGLAAQAAQLAEEAARRQEADQEKRAREREAEEELARKFGQWLDRAEAEPDKWPVRNGEWIRGEIAYGVHGDGWHCPPVHRERLQELRDRVEAELARRAKDELTLAKAMDDESRAWAAEHGETLSPELQRAAREGRHVRGEIARLVDQRVSEALGEALPDVPRVRAIFDEQVRTGVPSREAYALHDQLVALAPALRTAAGIPHPVICVSEVSRFDVSDEATVWRTGVKVTLVHLWTEASWVLLAEPLNVDGEDGEED